MTAERFPPGQLVATPGAHQALLSAGQSPLPFLMRHLSGDWGEVDEEDARTNELAVSHGRRIMSVYRTRRGTRLWLITEADRSATTFLLREEY